MPRSHVLLISVVLLLSGCGSGATVSSPSDGSTPNVIVAGTVATGLAVPWGIAFLPDGSALVSERDTARVVRIDDSQTRTVGTVAGVMARGEGGLLGIAFADERVYAYYTTPEDNRVVRMAWNDGVLGAAEPILTGIPKAGIHNGGRIAFGPDGMLYVATGDAAVPDSAQDPASLAGKILRIAPDGSVPADNPLPGSPVFSLGHRNVQGLAFDSRNRLWASEFGQTDADELNLISPGSNYGWPECEGACGRDPYVDPFVQWKPTSTASPSGVAILNDSAYVASLRGQVVFDVPLEGAATASEPTRETVSQLALGDLGRLRTIVAAPDGTLWLTTSNTDGRGDPRAGDDRILRLTVFPQR